MPVGTPRPYSHQPPDYRCPYCTLIAGGDDPGDGSSPADVVLRGDGATVIMAVTWWPRNAGHVVVVPNAHFENIFTLPLEAAAAIHAAAQRVAFAMKDAYACGGISTRQHNEPAGQQHVWHYHLHVFPRYDGDALYASPGAPTTAAQRAPYAQRLRAALSVSRG